MNSHPDMIQNGRHDSFQTKITLLETSDFPAFSNPCKSANEGLLERWKEKAVRNPRSRTLIHDPLAMPD